MTLRDEIAELFPTDDHGRTAAIIALLRARIEKPETVERAAKAMYNRCPIHDEYDDPRWWTELDPTEQESFISDATAALAAILDDPA